MQVPDEQVKEMTEYSLGMLKKMEQARVDAKYHEVQFNIIATSRKRSQKQFCCPDIYVLRHIQEHPGMSPLSNAVSPLDTPSSVVKTHSKYSGHNQSKDEDSIYVSVVEFMLLLPDVLLSVAFLPNINPSSVLWSGGENMP